MKVMPRDYKRALADNAKHAEEHGLGLFSSQWMQWDRMRRRLEPHENMMPGLENLPAPSLEQLKRASAAHTRTGHKTYTKIDPITGKSLDQLKKEAAARGDDFVPPSEVKLPPTKPKSKHKLKASDLAYFAAPPVAAGGGLMGLMGLLGDEERN